MIILCDINSTSSHSKFMAGKKQEIVKLFSSFFWREGKVFWVFFIFYLMHTSLSNKLLKKSSVFKAVIFKWRCGWGSLWRKKESGVFCFNLEMFWLLFRGVFESFSGIYSWDLFGDGFYEIFLGGLCVDLFRNDEKAN